MTDDGDDKPFDLSTAPAPAPAPAKPKRRGGRPTKYTPELAKKLCDMLTLGNYFETACELVGIDQATGQRWRASRREFREAVSKAQATAEAMLLGKIMSGKNVNGASWILERKFPTRWGRSVQAHVRIELERFLKILESRLPLEEYRRVLEIAVAGYADEQDGPPEPAPQPRLVGGS